MNPKPCGSELARDCVLTFNIDVDGYTAIASKLAPTVAGGDFKSCASPF